MTQGSLSAAILALTALLGLGGAAGAADVEAGRYVATAAGCSSCHTADGGEPYAGGLVLKTPFGPLASANITQDEATGIGTWTKEDFAKAVHDGMGKDDLPLYPAMPYLHYTKMTDADLDALWDYIKTIPAVNNKVEVNRLPFPFDVRPSLFGWRILFFEEGRFQPDTSKSADWNRGAYLVEALGHCGSCHTPRDPLGGPIRSRELQGAPIEEWYAPDISNGPKSIIADWDVARLEAFLSGNDGMNHVAVGSMRKVIGELTDMKAADRHAIAVYLKDQPPLEEPEKARPKIEVTAAERQAWGEIFEANCASCHQSDGKGVPGRAASLVGSGAVLAEQPDNIIAVLLEGIGPSGVYGVMPTFRNSLSDEEIAAVTNYVRTSWGNDAPANAQVSHVAGLRNITSPSPEALAAATCPNVAADRVSDALRKDIDALAAEKGLDRAKVAAVVSQYGADHPDATVTDNVADLGGVYCQDVVKTGAGKTIVITRQLAFMTMVADLAAQKKSEAAAGAAPK